MKRSLIALFILFAASASFAQTRNLQEQGYSGTGDLTRPRVVEVRAAEVRAAEVRSSVSVNVAGFERAAFDLVNQRRAGLGLSQLAWSDELADLARAHSRQMADNKFFSHRGLDDSMVSDRADRAGIRKWRSIGENIAFNRGYEDPVSVAVRLWLESPSHRQNMLSRDWREAAVGIAIAADGSYYFTQVFIKR